MLVKKRVNHVDLVKSFQTSIYYLLATFGVDTAENGPLKVCERLARSYKKVRKNIAEDALNHSREGLEEPIGPQPLHDAGVPEGGGGLVGARFPA